MRHTTVALGMCLALGCGGKVGGDSGKTETGGAGAVNTGGGGTSAGGTSAGGTTASGGSGGAAPASTSSAMSRCGGFEPMLLGDHTALDDEHCEASVLRWACSPELGGVELVVTRISSPSCAELELIAIAEGSGYDLLLSGNDEPYLCAEVCTFDVQTFLPIPCSALTIRYAEEEYHLPIEGLSSGEVVLSTEPAHGCHPRTGSGDEIAAAMTRASAVQLTGTRAWQFGSTGTDPREEEYSLQGEPMTWTLVFSSDASSVTVVASDGTTYEGRRIDSSILLYELDEFAGGVLAIDVLDGRYVAELRLLGSGVPVLFSVLGEVALTD